MTTFSRGTARNSFTRLETQFHRSWRGKSEMQLPPRSIALGQAASGRATRGCRESQSNSCAVEHHQEHQRRRESGEPGSEPLASAQARFALCQLTPDQL